MTSLYKYARFYGEVTQCCKCPLTSDLGAFDLSWFWSGICSSALDKDAIFLENDTWNHSSPDSPPTRMTQASSVFFGNQDYSRDNNFLKPLASTPGNGKTLPLGEFRPLLMRTYVASMPHSHRTYIKISFNSISRIIYSKRILNSKFPADKCVAWLRVTSKKACALADRAITDLRTKPS